jgi:hypothetical protein
MGTIHEDQNTFLISRSVLLIVRNVSDKFCRHNQKTFYIQKCIFEKRDVNEIMLKYIAQWGRPQTTIWHMRIACWTTNATNTYKHTHTHLQIYNYYSFSTVAMVARTRPSVKLYVLCLCL